MYYKLVRLRKNGTLASLFINRSATLPVGQWLDAEDHETKGYAHRVGWHLLYKPEAPHLSKKGRVWVLCEAKDVETFTRPESQGGKWALAQRIKILKILEDVAC